MTTLVKEAVERFWPDEIDMARALRKSPSRKTIDLARTALAEFEPFKAALLASPEQFVCEMCDDPAACPAERCAFRTAASLPTDDDDTVERAYRKGWNTGYNANTAGWKNVDEVIDESWIIDREAIHTLIGRDK